MSAGRHLLVATVLASLMSAGPALALNDPTRPPGLKTPASRMPPPRAIEVNAILLSADRRVVVIDGVPLQEGERHDGILVQRIEKRRIDILDRGRARTLRPDTRPQVRSLE